MFYVMRLLSEVKCLIVLIYLSVVKDQVVFSMQSCVKVSVSLIIFPCPYQYPWKLLKMEDNFNLFGFYSSYRDHFLATNMSGLGEVSRSPATDQGSASLLYALKVQTKKVPKLYFSYLNLRLYSSTWLFETVAGTCSCSVS